MTVYLLKLACRHKAKTDIRLRLQFHNDYHLVKCSTCLRTSNWFDSWVYVTHQSELPYEMRDVLKRIPEVVSDGIMRIQPKYRGRLAHKARPFPYRSGRT